ncbi:MULTISPECIES: hypothetical protein [Acetobacter]|uniref:hypothetical protein n=1 Tax=Acetobacter TaxID=434 RepID=UPI0002E81161|nr:MULTISPECIES: hypothetical protein [Acetobacter]ATI11047.1 hypothetical protein CPF11_00395 [Acetobacter pomorum]AXC26613.1 hypothetical protein DS739_07270 [Acetobacter sp. JWB]KAA8386028.1 hypothetical protein FKW31_07630 [Acetobacter sp. DmW_136]KAA8420352.1 hypothetical protein FKW54_14040 [Acetobacter pomorum]KAA8431401.1 hypothetical protein FKW50_13250 [Acetobacter pomorum]
MHDVTVDIDAVTEAVKRHLKQVLSGTGRIDFSTSVAKLKGMADRISLGAFMHDLGSDQNLSKNQKHLVQIYHDAERAATHALIIAILLRAQISLEQIQTDAAAAPTDTKH